MPIPERPLVSVAPAAGWGWPKQVKCSACGDVTDAHGSATGSDAAKAWLQRRAYEHAEAVHDGDVDREGWA